MSSHEHDRRFRDDDYHEKDEDLEKAMAVLRRFKKRDYWLIGLGLVALILIFSSFYTIKTDEVGVIQRFGAYVNTVKSGLHMKIPFGIDTVTKLKGSDYIFPVEFGYLTTQAGVRSEMRKGKEFEDEALMLTGDLNCAWVTWVVQYRIINHRDYLFNVISESPKEGPIGTFRDASEAVMRKVVGNHSVDEVIILSRRTIAQLVKGEMQILVDFYKMGMFIETVELQDVTPPDPVKPSFNSVNQAQQQMEKTVNNAWEAYNKVIPKAKGEAEKTIKQAEGYALDRVNRARGDANKFISVYNEYRLSKDVTRRRMYIETMLDVLPKIEKKFIVDKNLKGILPIMNLTGLEEGGSK